MPVRYQAALRPGRSNYIKGHTRPCVKNRDSCDGRPEQLAAQHFDDALDFLAQRREIRAGSARAPRRLRDDLVEAVARAVDGEALVVEQLADAADKKHFVVLVVAPVAAALDRLELREFLLPIAQHVRLHAAQLAYFADCEVALRRDRRELRSRAMTCFHGSSAPPSPSAFATRGTSRRDAP